MHVTHSIARSAAWLGACTAGLCCLQCAWCVQHCVGSGNAGNWVLHAPAVCYAVVPNIIDHVVDPCCTVWLLLQAYVKARADALARVGSRSPAAEAVSQLLLWGHPAAWLPTPIMGALLELVCCEPEGDQAELVQGAYQLLSAVSKVRGWGWCCDCWLAGR
jgi:hypothetical protein